jgi:cytoskeleton protein RodZ
MLGGPSGGRVRVDPAESLMREVGAQLRQRRLERGEDLDDVARSLRIKPSYLFGIEQGDLSALPGRPYALGFLRSYADYLGFDGDDLVGKIKAAVADLTDRTRLRIRMPMPENRLPQTPVVVISLAVVVGVYAGWTYINHSSRMAVDTVAEVPNDLRDRTIEASSRNPDEEAPVAGVTTGGLASDGVAAAEAPSTAAATEPAAAGAAAQAPDAPPAPLAGPPGQAAEELALSGHRDALTVQPAAGLGAAEPDRTEAPSPERTEPASAAGAALDQASSAGGAADASAGEFTAMQVLATLDPAAGGPEGPRVYERANADARVILRAREPAWIQVSSPAGDYTFTRTLQPGEALLVPNRPDLELWTGNAGGLEVIVDGAAVAVLAGGGAVRRHVSLDPERLRAAADREP